MSIFQVFGAVVGAAHSAIEGLASLGLPVALAIVVFTVLVRLAISPLTYLQIRSGRRREALTPALAALRRSTPAIGRRWPPRRSRCTGPTGSARSPACCRG